VNSIPYLHIFLIIAGLNCFGFLYSAGIQFGDWEQTKPSSLATPTSSKDQAYRSLRVIAGTVGWHGIRINTALPLTMVHKKGQPTKYGITDLSLAPSFQWKFLMVKTAFTFPMFYETNIHSIWLGSGNTTINPEIVLSNNIKSIGVYTGLGGRFKYYLNDARIGWGSWEAIIKNYWVKPLGKTSIGLEWSITQKSLIFYQFLSGYGKNGQILKEGWGALYEPLEVVGGFFISQKLNNRISLKGGYKNTLYREIAPAAFSFWGMVDYSFGKE